MGLFLHQTTTDRDEIRWCAKLFMGLFLHQTTTILLVNTFFRCCLWVFSYIKPQPLRDSGEEVLVVYGSFPTSNHNAVLLLLIVALLFMGLFLHQTTTRLALLARRFRCLWVFSYIKPQLQILTQQQNICCLWVFSYIKPQPWGGRDDKGYGCLWVFSYIKPQHF